MKLKDFLDCACDDIHINEGEDDNHAIIAIIPCNALDEAKDNLSDSLLDRTVYLFTAKGDDKITVYLKKEE